MPFPLLTGHRSLMLPVAALLLLLTAGCAVGPDYEAPVFETPDAWENAAAADIADSNAVLVSWWTTFNDTLLNNLMAEADDGNLDLIQAVGRLKEARAFRQIAGGNYWPQVGLDGGFTRTELGENGSFGGLAGAGASNPSSNWEFGLGASWELDVFGRVRRSVEAANAQVQASLEDYRDVMVSLYADIATTYVSIRSLQARLDFARNNVQQPAGDHGDRGRPRRSRPRVHAGRHAGPLQPGQHRGVHPAAGDPAGNRPATCWPSCWARRPELSTVGWRPPARSGCPTTRSSWTLPANILRRRPDVRRSERNLAAQTARIGVATADLYPSFSLTACSRSAGDRIRQTWVRAGSLGWSLAPGVRWNLFSGGKIRGQIRVEEARTEQALAAYEQTVLNALGEVENALVAVRQEEMRLGSLRIAVEASRQSVELVRTQYIEGLTDFQNYLDSQRDPVSPAGSDGRFDGAGLHQSQPT